MNCVGVPESYNGTNMITCIDCGRTAPDHQSFYRGECDT